MTTLEEAFEQFKQLPDWDRYPMPEVFYEHFKVKKPKPTNGIMEALVYTPPPHASLNKGGKIEIRGPAPDGVREIKDLMSLPVEVKVLTDETDDDMQQDSDQSSSNHPIEDSNSKTLPSLDRLSPSPSCVVDGSAPSAPCHDAECNPPSQPPQSA